MKRFFTKKRIIALAILAILLLAWGIYARPRTVAELAPELAPESCTGIRVRYQEGKTDVVEYTLAADDPHFQQLWDLLMDRSYRRSLSDLLPRGTRTHAVQEGDFQWELWLDFDFDPPLELPSGSAATNGAAEFLYWYGQLDLSIHTGDPLDHRVTTAHQEAWARQVLEILTQPVPPTPAEQLVALPTSPPEIPRPESTDLELWILDGAPGFSWTDSHQTVAGVFGPDIWYGAGYGRDSAVSVTYSHRNWPDRKSPFSYLTGIEITDPAVNILNGLTLRSTEEEWAAGLAALGLEEEIRANSIPADQRELLYRHPEDLYWIRLTWAPDWSNCRIGATVTNVTNYIVVY